MPEDLLGRVLFGTVGWQIERMHARWPNHLPSAMTAELSSTTPIEPLPNSWRRCSRKISKHWFSTVESREKDAGARCGFHRRP